MAVHNHTVIYAMSDIHGNPGAFEEALALVDLSDPGSALILCGDYIDHAQTTLAVCERIRALQERWGDQVVALKGNHEAMYLEDERRGAVPALPRNLRIWLRDLPLYYETDRQVFVHAGIDEEAGEWWRWGSEDAYFYEKYPAVFGPFEKDIVAGHVGTFSLCGENRVFWDGQAHYYLDGSTEVSGVIPVLMYDGATGRYLTFERCGESETADTGKDEAGTARENGADEGGEGRGVWRRVPVMAG